MSSYEEWLANRERTTPCESIVGSDLNERMFPHQRNLVDWALGRGRAAIFADTGLGKTLMQTEWARVVSERGRVLILAPLAVAEQTVREAAQFGIECVYRREDRGDRITVANYEMLSRFDPHEFVGIVLDESSILKSFDGSTRTAIIEAFQNTPFRLACTATPAPNDHTELGNHAEFLGIQSRVEMLSEYFVHDAAKTQDWRLKGHAREAFWRWVCSWAAVLRKPSDLGYSDEGFDIPPLVHEELPVPVDHEVAWTQGSLYAVDARTLSDQRALRRATMAKRVEMIAAEIASEPNEPAIVWCELNEESSALAKAIPGSVEVKGADSHEYKAAAADWFAGRLCVCNHSLFRAKLAAWRANQDTGESTTESTESRDSRSRSPISRPTRKSERSTCRHTTRISLKSSGERQSNKPSSIEGDAKDTHQIQSTERSSRPCLADDARSQSVTEDSSLPSELDRRNTTLCLPLRADGAQSVEQTPETENASDFTSTTATQPDSSADCSADHATSESESSETIRSSSVEPPCICGSQGGARVLISKVSIFGFGLNWQHCARIYFMGASHSYEQTYQAIRRCYRFGQKRQVVVRTCVADTEHDVIENVARKHREAEEMGRQMIEQVSRAGYATRNGARREWNNYNPSKSIEVPSWLC